MRAETAALRDAAAAVQSQPRDLQAKFALADVFSEAGCFDAAVQVLTQAAQQSPASIEAMTRLRVARSVVGEERFFDRLDQADDQARFKRADFRCATLFDVPACAEAVSFRPVDPALLTRQGDALAKSGRTAEALIIYQQAVSRGADREAVEATIAAMRPPETPAAIELPEQALPPPSAAALPHLRLARANAPIGPRAASQHTSSPAPSPPASNVEPETQSH